MNLNATFGTTQPIIGMVHLPALPGAPRADDGLDAIEARAVRDAEALSAGGVDAVMIENFDDAPFYPDDVPKHTVASMTRLGRAVREAADLPVGVNVLRNDGPAAVSVAHAIGGAFVRVNVHTGARVADQGVLQGRAHETMRLRSRLDAEDVAVLADVDVKHSGPLTVEEYSAESFAAGADRGLADATVVTGQRTGRPTDPDDVREIAAAKEAEGVDTPVFVGSGVAPDNVADLLAVADGAVVGSSLKRDGDAARPVDEDRVRALMDVVEDVRS